jgi:hypothetical protein
VFVFLIFITDDDIAERKKKKRVKEKSWHRVLISDKRQKKKDHRKSFPENQRSDIEKA